MHGLRLQERDVFMALALEGHQAFLRLDNLLTRGNASLLLVTTGEWG